MRKRICQIFCITGMMILIGFSIAYFFADQRTMSGAEELSPFPAFSFSAYLEGDFQNAFEQAAKDQFILYDKAVAWNADWNAKVKGTGKRLSSFFRGKGFEEKLEPFGKVYHMYDSKWLMNLPYSYEEETEAAYQRKAGEINDFANAHPYMQVYVYYCTRAEDLNWFDEAEGLKSYPWYELLKASLQDTIRFDRMKFRDFSEYQSRMYRTDHHWNHIGAAVGYADILHMMGKDYDMGMAKSILKEQNYGNLLWIGSRARECGKNIENEDMDVFTVNEYILPQHTTWFGNKKQDIGLKKSYDNGAVNREIGFDQYLNYFGFESDVITLQYEKGEHNLLIIGDSFARAIREPISSHFKTTVFVNFRILEKVDLEEICRENEIDTLLFMGQQDAWSGYFLNKEEEVK